MKKIDYLDLGLGNYYNKKVTLDIDCNIEGNFTHNRYIENSQLNSLVDLLINLGRNLKLKFEKIDKNLKLFLVSLRENRANFKSVEEKLDFIKD